ncbi:MULTISPECIES: lipopolysaccharide biosynthesis protein [Pseudomonas]|uniref:lipopolysaccharide biosynthesis protein n=1 Tax=Pseudomonas TaxID=286 RepID=UPI000C86B297|nr:MULTISPECIES: lipopolysaccharide biosynthesis protein [Pseudomonas]PMV85466.1 hypothetical protein C1X56_19010 [Pseudomonas sp. GW101-1A09]PMV97035.1 hypothetical protein C1X51_06345 [Pseudomonas sp. FW306-2-2C-B10A]PMV98299.1 hypothetical protein C1X55_15015 [Pseudomonas sp. GW460-C8]PMW05627.1 hypothetical protein C1X50_11885 [Pseudomonas sp. MPR-TSA4]PMW14774.1 hypothetical protein C1X40_21760 [Pseudomonas sp. GW456-11-11-14-TSB2]
MTLIRKLIPENSFARNAITLMTGTSIAQAIPIAISPILTRLYTPEQFGVFGLYLALTSIVSVVVTGRYELAIMLPKKDSEAAQIVALSVVLSFLISSIILLCVVFFNTEITHLLGAPELSLWLYLLPLSTLLGGVYPSLNYWCNRKRNYKRLALSRIVQTSATSSIQLGVAGVGPSVGLIGGQILGQGVATVVLGRIVVKEDAELLRSVTKLRVLAVARKYTKFPKYMVAGQLASEVSVQILLLLLGMFFGPAIAGFYSLAQRVLAAPISLVAAAIGDVYRQEAAFTYKKTGNCKDLFLRTALKLFAFAFIPALPVFFFGPWLFALFFGEEWRAAGEMASVVSIMVFFQTVSTPLSQTVLFAGMQSTDLIWQLSRLGLSLLSFYIAYTMFNNYQIAIIMHVVLFSFLYLTHTVLQYRAASGKVNNK